MVTIINTPGDGNNNNGSGTVIAVVLIVITLLILAFFVFSRGDTGTKEVGDATQTLPQQTADEEVQNRTMTLVLYLQDKQEAVARDCGVTIPTSFQVPHTTGVVDLSLRRLFEEELANFGTYDSVRIVDGVAQVTLKNDRTASGSTFGALSSCESRHLMSVLNDTLAQYDTINSVELYTPQGKVEF